MNSLRLYRYLLLGFLAAAANIPAASAQYYYRGYEGGYHASTAAEGYARGMADVVRAEGARNLANSRAAINVEEARSRYIDNRVKSTNAYWERRKIYDENMAEKRYEQGKRRLAQRNRVMLRELTPDQLNTTTGAIQWPMLLRDSSYDNFRQPLDELFAKRARYGVLDSDDYLQAKDLIREWRAAVTARKATYPEAALRSSLRFLLKLNRDLDENLG